MKKMPLSSVPGGDEELEAVGCVGVTSEGDALHERAQNVVEDLAVGRGVGDDAEAERGGCLAELVGVDEEAGGGDYGAVVGYLGGAMLEMGRERERERVAKRTSWEGAS